MFYTNIVILLSGPSGTEILIVQNAFIVMEAMTPVPCKEAINQGGELSHIL